MIRTTCVDLKIVLIQHKCWKEKHMKSKSIAQNITLMYLSDTKEYNAKLMAFKEEKEVENQKNSVSGVEKWHKSFIILIFVFLFLMFMFGLSLSAISLSMSFLVSLRIQYCVCVCVFIAFVIYAQRIVCIYCDSFYWHVIWCSAIFSSVYFIHVVWRTMTNNDFKSYSFLAFNMIQKSRFM